MALTYDWSVDLGDANSTITLQYHAVPPGSLVLDVGCATGFLGAALAERKGCTYVGLELDEAQAAAGRERGLDVLTGDITDEADRRRVVAHAGRRFDVIVLGDVLEHLPDPFTTLRALVDGCLDRAGLIVTSIPNVTHGSLRLDLLRGRFTYTPTGLLDVTHVQLFTRQRVGELYDRAGLDVVTDQRSYFPVFGTEGRVQQGEFPAEIEQYVLRDPESFTYQFITTGRPALRRGAGDGQGSGPRAEDATDVLVVLPVGSPTAAWREALAAAVPDRCRLEVAEPVGDTVDVAVALESMDDLVLVVDAETMPAASWVGPLLEAQRRHGGVVGAVRAADGVVDAAGWTQDGGAVGRGASLDHPFLQADRREAHVGPPWVGPASAAVPDAAGRLPGRLVAAAVASTGSGAGPSVPFAAAMPRATVVVGRHGPHRLDEGSQRAIAAAADLGPVVYRWTGRDLLDSREHARHLLAEGITLVGGNSSELAGAHVPSTAALARTLDAGRVVWLDADLARDEVLSVGVLHPGAQRVGPSDGPPHLDATDPIAALALPPPVAQHAAAAPPAVTPVDAVPGRVSVVIPMYGLGGLTAAAVEAVRATTGHLDVEVIVVDNGSPAADTEAVERVTPDVLVRHEENLGFARGVNAGIEVATGQYVCVLNNDTEPLDGWLDELLAALARPGALLVSARSDQVSGPQRLSDVPLIADDPAAARAAGSEHGRARAGVVFPLGRLVGFCLLVERRTLEEHGGIVVPDALGNFEDDELSSRLLAAGGELLVADGSVVLHHGSRTFRLTEVDYTDQLLRAARSLDAPFPAGGTLGVVVSDGAAPPVLRSVRSLAAVTDEVVVLAAAHGPDLALLLADQPHVRVASSAEDVAADPRPHVVLLAGEELVVDDAARARAALHEAAVPAALATAVGPQQRWLPAGRFDLLGPGANPLPGLQVV